jgi:hypothetical protein
VTVAQKKGVIILDKPTVVSALLAVVCLVAASVSAQELAGPVRVIDGDTL